MRLSIPIGKRGPVKQKYFVTIKTGIVWLFTCLHPHIPLTALIELLYYLLTAYWYNIFRSVMPNKWRTIKSLVHKIRLHGRRGKGTAVFFSRKKNKACTAEGKWMRNSVCPSVRPRLVQVVHPTNLTSRINGKKTPKNTKTQVAPVVQLVTSKPSEVGTRVRISVSSQEQGFFLIK